MIQAGSLKEEGMEAGKEMSTLTRRHARTRRKTEREAKAGRLEQTGRQNWQVCKRRQTEERKGRLYKEGR
jgi:hypothetical protein